MQCHNLHYKKPELGELIVWLNPQLKEVFGHFKDNTLFIEIIGPRRGYIPKWWRYPTDVEHNQFILIPESKPLKKRGRPPKNS